MSYPLRLPEHLETAARERAAGIGISFNAFICVCVDAYLQGAKPAGDVVESQSRPGRKPKPQHQQLDDDESDDDGERPDWRFFHSDADMWPFVDPDPTWRAFVESKWPGDTTNPATLKAIEEAYWSTRKRPD